MTSLPCTTKDCPCFIFSKDSNICRKCTKEQKDNVLHESIYQEIAGILTSDMTDFESMSDLLLDHIMETRIALSTKEIRALCQVYFDQNGKNAETLQNANLLFRTMDHARNMNQSVPLDGLRLSYV